MKAEIKNKPQLETLLKTVVETTYNEQEAIGRVIHGDICGLLSMVKMEISKHKRLVETGTLKIDGVKTRNYKIKKPQQDFAYGETLLYLDEAFASLKVLSRNLNPSQIKDLGLLKALLMYNRELEDTSKIEVQFVNNSLYQHKLPLEYEIERNVYTLYKKLLTYFSEYVECLEIKIVVNNDAEHIIFDFINLHSKAVKKNGVFPYSPELKKLLDLIEAMLLLSGGSIDTSSDLIEKIQIRIPFLITE